VSHSTSRLRAGARRRVLAAVGIGLATAIVGSGCAAGQIAHTAQISSAVEGSHGTVGPIAVRDVKLAYPQDGRYTAGEDARVTLVLANAGIEDDVLTAVRSDAADSVVFQSGQSGDSATPLETQSPSESVAPGEESLPGQESSLTVPGNENVLAYADGPRITLLGLNRDLLPSQTVKLTFTFRDAGEVTLDAPVAIPATPGTQPTPVDIHPTD
jgi:Uncharacterized protein conserved in bacteria